MTALLEFGTRRHLLVHGIHRVGRDARRCELALEDDQVSRVHAWFVGIPGEWLVLDLRSANGLRVNDRPVAAATLEEGDQIQVGRTRMRFRFASAAEAARAEAVARGEGRVADPLAAYMPAGIEQIAALRARAGGQAEGRLGVLRAACDLAASGWLRGASELGLLVRELLACDQVVVFRPGDGPLRPLVAVDARGVEVVREVAPRRRVMAQQAVAAGDVVYTRDLGRDPRFGGGDGARGINAGAALALPLVDRGRLVAVVQADNRLESDWFGEEERVALRAFGPFAARALGGDGGLGDP